MNDHYCINCVHYAQHTPDDASITECHAPNSAVHSPSPSDTCDLWSAGLTADAHPRAYTDEFGRARRVLFHAKNYNSEINQCPTCSLYFNSDHSFDKHRTGTIGNTTDNPRRCMSEEEMLSRGMGINKRGWWVSEVLSQDKIDKLRERTKDPSEGSG